MYSCERHRTAAYSEDIRHRMVYQAVGLRKSYRQIASTLNVDPSTVQRTVKLFEETGSIQKRQYPSNIENTKLTEFAKMFIITLVIEKPGIYLHEVKDILYEYTGIDVQESTICKALMSCGLSRQKMTLVSNQRSELLRSQYVLDMSIYQGCSDLFVFIDEMGCDRRDRYRKYAYGLKGKAPTKQCNLFRGEHVSAIVAMTNKAVLDFSIVTGGVSAETFDHFVITALLPHLQPFDGLNPCSIVVLDNASIHHASDMLSYARNAGCLVYYLPPYSPDLNPIEYLFSKVKSILKKSEEAWYNFTIQTAVAAALNCITQEDCESWFMYCGYQ